MSIGRLRTCFGSQLAYYQIRDENRAKLKISYSCGHRVSKSARYDDTLMDNQVAIDGYDFFRKDRTEIHDKGGGGIIIYFRNTIKCKRRTDLEISQIETIWMEIELPNSKHFLFCST